MPLPRRARPPVMKGVAALACPAHCIAQSAWLRSVFGHRPYTAPRQQPGRRPPGNSSCAPRGPVAHAPPVAGWSHCTEPPFACLNVCAEAPWPPYLPTCSLPKIAWTGDDKGPERCRSFGSCICTAAVLGFAAKPPRPKRGLQRHTCIHCRTVRDLPGCMAASVQHAVIPSVLCCAGSFAPTTCAVVTGPSC